jgi:uroporphyrinogen-III decarboxylase
MPQFAHIMQTYNMHKYTYVCITVAAYTLVQKDLKTDAIQSDDSEASFSLDTEKYVSYEVRYYTIDNINFKALTHQEQHIKTILFCVCDSHQIQ